MTRTVHVAVVGSGLAGSAAAAAAIDSGATVQVFERHADPGGITRDSAGWIWRYVDAAAAARHAPHADPLVAAAIVGRLDTDLVWLESLGVRWIATGTGRSFTHGVRVDPRQLLDVLHARIEHQGPDMLQLRTSIVAARRAPDDGIELCVREHRGGRLADAPDRWQRFDAVVFAGGGYAADMERIEQEAGVASGARDAWLLRSARGGDGSSLDCALQLGAVRMPPTGESLVRLAPNVRVPIDPRLLTRFGELLGADVRLRVGRRDDAPYAERAPHDWSGAMLGWDLARAGTPGRIELSSAQLRARVHGGVVEDIVRDAIAAGAPAGRLATGGVWIEVVPGITHTRCGLRVDGDGRLQQLVAGRLRRRLAARALAGCYAAGCDAAGSGLGGIASGLAQALVLGRAAGAAAAG